MASLDELDAEFGEVGLGAKCRNLRLQREGGVLIWQIGLIGSEPPVGVGRYITPGLLTPPDVTQRL